jgi:hypothetical protein
MLLAGTSFAQSVVMDQQLRPATADDVLPQTSHPSQIGGERDILFSEDFANGLAGNNGVGAWTVSGPDGNIWRRKVTGPLGAYTPTSERIQSTTVTNGYMLFNSDSANSSWNGNTPTALPTDQFTNWEGSLESPALDLSATPNAQLQFQQRLRYCCSSAPQFVEVSVDGGNSWPHSIDVGSDFATNTLSPTETREINLTPFISGGNASNVKFRFRHNAEAGTSHYHWQIDDVQIVDQPQYDLLLDYALISNTTQGNEPGRIPTSQLVNGGINLGGGFNNFGWDTHNNINLMIDVTGPEAFQHTINVPQLESPDTVDVWELVTPPQMPVGLYTANFTLTSDEEPDTSDLFENNTVPARTFQITETIYSLDNIGNHPAGQQVTSSLGSASFTDNEDGGMAMTQYHILAPMEVYGLDVILQNTGTSATQAGGQIVMALRDSADIFVDMVTFTPNLTNALAETDLITVEQMHVTLGRISADFTSPITLQPGIYYASVEMYGSGDNNRISIVDDETVPQPGWSSLMYLPNDPNSPNRVWSNGNAFGIRLRTTSSVGIEENSSLTNVSVMPNPTTGITILNYTIAESAPVTIDLTDVAGKLVRTYVVGNKAAGQHQLNMDLADLQNGAYNYTVNVGASRSSGRIIIAK